MKPSAGMIPRIGVFEQSPTLDQMGLFAMSLEDLGLVTDALSIHDSRDPQHRRTETVVLSRCLLGAPGGSKLCDPNSAVQQTTVTGMHGRVS